MLARIRQAWKTHGAAALPGLLLRKALAKVVRTETLVIYRHSLNDSTLLSLAHNPSVRFVKIDRPNADLFDRLCSRYPERNFCQRMEHGGRQCFVAMREDRIVGYAWVASSNLYIDEIACTYPVATSEIFIYDCFIDDDCRGKGIYPALLGAVLQDHCKRYSGLERACIAAVSRNRASIRGILKAGFVELTRVRYVECGQLFRKWWGLTPGYGMRIRGVSEYVDGEF
jgi:GNAT superfamily N-acetyltransferase